MTEENKANKFKVQTEKNLNIETYSGATNTLALLITLNNYNNTCILISMPACPHTSAPSAPS